MADAISIKGLQKVIDRNLALDVDSLTVATGEIVALVGPTGSGKAVLLDLLVGRSTPTVGSVRVAGIDPLAERERFSRHVGVLFLEDSLYARQSARANLAFYCRLLGLPKSRAEEVLRQVGLADHASTRVDRLASGMARRLAFGRAILHHPSVLLLVDPLARCDEASISLLGNLIRQLSDEGVTALILADDTGHLAELCDTVYALNQGRLVESPHLEQEPEAALPFKVPAHLEGKVVLVNPADVLFADVEEGRAFLNTAEGRLPTQFTLTDLEERLSRRGFFRAHRAYLVNLQHVKEVIRYTRNSFSLRLDDDAGTKIPLSKSAAGELRDLMGY